MLTLADGFGSVGPSAETRNAAEAGIDSTYFSPGLLDTNVVPFPKNVCPSPLGGCLSHFERYLCTARLRPCLSPSRHSGTVYLPRDA